MSTEKDSYKQIFKATSIFGGIQIFNILISIIRSKVIAVLLGPAGLGLISIFNSTATLIAACTNLGINVSAVKSIAAADQHENPERVMKITAVFKRLIWITGLLGLLVTVILSPYLSQISFGNKSYTFSFVLIGLSLLALQLSAGQNAILQGLRKIRLIALSSLFGALIGLGVSVPLYFYLGQNGIVPAIVATSFAGVLTSWYFLRKAQIPSSPADFKTLKAEGKEMVKLGFLISLTSLFTLASNYLVRLFIINHGSLQDVGLYTAGFAIIGTYVGMIFSAMGTDYYPSLAAIAGDNKKCNEKVNHQILMSILILAPILTGFLVFIKFGIIVLYSGSFLGVISLLHWAALGVFFQAFSWCIAFIFLAKGDSKLFFWNEFIPNLYIMALNCIAYYLWKLEGLGISFLAGYIIYFVQVLIIAGEKYGFKIHSDIIRICGLQFLISCGAFVVVYFFSPVVAYTFGSLLIAASVSISLYTLEKKMGFLHLLKRKTT